MSLFRVRLRFWLAAHIGYCVCMYILTAVSKETS